jgi:hypothetical protein
MAKTAKANELFSKLNSSINSQYTDKKVEFNKAIELPNFINKTK